MQLDLIPSLVKAVELSNSHITFGDMELLTAAATEYSMQKLPPIVMLHECGFVIPIGELTCNSLQDAGASPELAAILDACEKSGDIMYLCFDRDAAEQDGLPVFSW